MYLWRGLAAVGLVALGVAGFVFGGVYLAAAPVPGPDATVVSVAYLSFFLGTAVLLAAVLARGLSQVNRAVALARQTE